MTMCRDCIFKNLCGSDITVLLNDCWAAVDNDFNNDENVLNRKDGEGHWREMSYYKIPLINNNSNCYELSEWEIYLKEEEKESISMSV